MRRLLIVCISINIIVAKAQAWTCWLPDGKSFDNVGMIPCNSTLEDSTEGSACCDPRDACTTSGMCLGESGYTYRGGCTDSTFTSSNCPSYCLIGNYILSGEKRNPLSCYADNFQIQSSIRATTEAQTSIAAVTLACSPLLSAAALIQTRFKIAARLLSFILDPDTHFVLGGTPKNFFLRRRTTAQSPSLQPLQQPQSTQRPRSL